MINDFYFIDSLKKNNLYKKYQDSIPLKDQKRSIGAYAIYSFKLDTINCYLWYIHQESGKKNNKWQQEKIYASFSNQDSVISCHSIAELYTKTKNSNFKDESQFVTINSNGEFKTKIYQAGGKLFDKKEFTTLSIKNRTCKFIEGGYNQVESKLIYDLQAEKLKKEQALKEKMYNATTIEDFKDVFKPINRFPIHIDSVLFANIQEKSKPIYKQQIKILSKNLKSIKESYTPDWVIKDFIKIDSLKQINKYQEYSQTLDLGMTQFSEAYALNQFKLDSINCYTWCIDHSSVEACPHGYGTEVFISFVQKDSVVACYQIAEISGGADAPYWSERNKFASIYKTGTFKFETKEQNGGETDENGFELIDITMNDIECQWIDFSLKTEKEIQEEKLKNNKKVEK